MMKIDTDDQVEGKGTMPVFSQEKLYTKAVVANVDQAMVIFAAAEPALI